MSAPLDPCSFCGFRFDHDRLGKFGCPNCLGQGLVVPVTAGCVECAKPFQYRRRVDFDCVSCCVRHLRQMTPAEQAINAPIIQQATNPAHFDTVRSEYKKRMRP